MERDWIEEITNEDETERIMFYRELYSWNPLETTDEPLHVEDWSERCSIMERNMTKHRNAAECLRELLSSYGNNKRIIKALKDNYKSKIHSDYENGLSYDRSRKEWIIYSWQPSWKDYLCNIHEAHWVEEWSFSPICVDIYNIAPQLSDEQISSFCDEKYFTDGVKIVSYSFGYNGEVTFHDYFDIDTDGIAYLIKDEFLKYTGHDESYWKKPLKEIEWLIGEIESWTRNDVFGYLLENKIICSIQKEYVNVEREPEYYEEDEWQELDSCGGFYGDYEEMKKVMIDYAGFNK